MLSRVIILLSVLHAFLHAAPLTQESIAQRYTQVINGVVALTADDYVSTGKYEIDGDIEYKVYHLPVSHDFKPVYKDFNFYLNGSYSYGKVESDEALFEGEVADEYTLKMDMYKLGAGVRYRPNEHFYIRAGYALIYSHVNSQYAYNSVFSKIILKPLLDNLVNDSQSNWTSEFALSFRYEKNIYGFLPYAFGEMKWYKTRTKLDLEKEYKLSSHAEIYRVQAGSFTPSLYRIEQKDIKLKGFVGRTYYGGDIQATGTSTYYNSYGAGVYLFSKSKSFFIESVGLVSEWSQGKNFNGYNIGLDIEFDF